MGEKGRKGEKELFCYVREEINFFAQDSNINWGYMKSCWLFSINAQSRLID
jgi:hypothetical protein